MKRFLSILLILPFILTSSAQKRMEFTYKDNIGCVFVFKTETATSNEVALISASNKKNAELEIPANVSNKGNMYVVTRIENESLKDCDDCLCELVFPNTTKKIGGLLFGSVIKLSGGIGGLMKGGTGGPLSNIKLDRIVIPESVDAIGSSAFLTGFTKEGNKGLKGNIDELPLFVRPWNAREYGLEKNDVFNFWQRKDSSMLATTHKTEAKQKKLRELYEKNPQKGRQDELKYFSSNDESDKEVAKTLLESVSDYGITREEYIAALQGQYGDNNVTANFDEIYDQFKESVERGNINLLSYVKQAVDMDNNEQQALVQKFRQYENKGNYKGALKTVTKMMDYTSDPRLRFVRAVCLYKTNEYRKSMEESTLALCDGRLSEDEMNFAGMMGFVSGQKYEEKMLQKVEKWERMLGVADQVADEAITKIVTDMASDDKEKGSTTATASPVSQTVSQNSLNKSPKIPRLIRCPRCEGKGKCVSCEGTGERKKHYKKNGKWHDTIDCPECDGSGKCSECGGTRMIHASDDSSSSSSSTSSSNSSKSSSTSKNSSEKTYRTCSWCNGSGRILKETEQQGATLQGEKKGKCSECGAQLYRGKGHKHYNCSHCNGTGKLEN